MDKELDAELRALTLWRAHFEALKLAEQRDLSKEEVRNSGILSLLRRRKYIEPAWRGYRISDLGIAVRNSVLAKRALGEVDLATNLPVDADSSRPQEKI